MNAHIGKSHIRPFINCSRSLNEGWQVAMAAATAVGRCRPDGLFAGRFPILDSVIAVPSFTIAVNERMIREFVPQVASRAIGRDL
jgi:hypothetical protein